MSEENLVSPIKKIKLVFLISEDWFFCSHFLERAVAASKNGFDVTVLTRVTSHGDKIQAAGIRLHSIPFQRKWSPLLEEWQVLRSIMQFYKTERPDILHHVALKPILLGSLAAKLKNLHSIVNAPVGMGYAFSSARGHARLMRLVVRKGLRWLLNPPGSRVIFENKDDLEELISNHLARRETSVLIRGAGVDAQRFQPAPEPRGIPIVALPARILWDKGVQEFIEAARLLKTQSIAVRLVVVGAPDPENHAAVPEKQITLWKNEGVVEWWGHRQDMPEVFASIHIVCLPSYREGLPKVLLEAGACGRPIITTDVQGCREAVLHGVNGLLVPPRNSDALAQAIAALVAAPQERHRMGNNGRAMVLSEFSQEHVVEATLAVYRNLLMQ